MNQGDELLEVARNIMNGKSAFEAASLIQGPKGTKVSLKVGFDSCITLFVSIESFLSHKSLCSWCPDNHVPVLGIITWHISGAVKGSP